MMRLNEVEINKCFLKLKVKGEFHVQKVLGVLHGAKEMGLNSVPIKEKTTSRGLQSSPRA